MMIANIICALVLLPLLPAVRDVVLPSVLSSDVHCPSPHVFDHFVCMCVDPSLVKVRVPTEGRTSLELRVLEPQVLATPPVFRLPQYAGLPDMHFPGRSSSWRPVRPFPVGARPRAGQVVPSLNLYGSYNVPASSRALKPSAKTKGVEVVLPTKQQELLEKVRWQEQLKRESVAVAAAELAVAAAAAASAAAPAPTDVAAGESPLDSFMRDTLRRILYRY